jgi:hypothetical protein
MLYREIIGVCSQIHTKHVKYIVWAERRIPEYIKPGGARSNQRTLKVSKPTTTYCSAIRHQIIREVTS